MRNRNDFLIGLRNNKNWTQNDVVDELKNKYGIAITSGYYGIIENGRRPSMKVGYALAELFEVTIDSIFFKNQHNDSMGLNEISAASSA